MKDAFVTVRLSRDQAEFLQANLTLLAAKTREVMARPDLAAERRTDLVNRALSLESIEDAVSGALLNILSSDEESGEATKTDSDAKTPRRANHLDGSFGP